MKDISLQDCINFQDCFLYDGKFYPFDGISNYKQYFPLAIIGEFGGILDIICKQVRSKNFYTDQLVDECADMFIYLLLFGRMLEINNEGNIFGMIKVKWDQPSSLRIKPEDINNTVYDFLQILSRLLGQKRHTESYDVIFGHIFEYIKGLNEYLNNISWQETINKFHFATIIKYTDPGAYTPDEWYKGTTRIDFNKLLLFINTTEIKIPVKRLDFLKRMAVKDFNG